MSNELSKNKALYKLFLFITKYFPIFLFIMQTIALILNYFNIVLPILTCITGSSLLFMFLLLLISYVFRYCYLYRIPIWGNIIIGILCILRFSGYLPINLIDLYRLFTFVISLTVILFVIVAYKTRNNPKIDYIKQFCERYNCNCK